ncbi:CD302 antigen [Dendropsophus ebraccatus]|uniref:CD302 antigen n=1 Tax=Dendropsophus ebraccatus TaxID=150705 RepID=UPI00383119B9
MGRTLSYASDEVSSRRTRTALLLCLCSAVCHVSGQSVPVCPSPSWVQFGSSCYTVDHVAQKTSLSIEPAREHCKGLGADIISINSKEENLFLVKTFQAKWEGPTEVLLGMFYDSDDNSLKWYDKSKVTFLNWKQEQLEDNNLNTCVIMNTQSGLWDITDCDRFSESAVLCKYIPKENRTFDKKAMEIAIILIFTIVTLVVPIVVIIVNKRRNWPSRLPGAQVLPYSDEAFLVDTMESEDYA